MLLTTTTDEVHRFACLHDLDSQSISQEGWDHDVVELILLGPEFIIRNQRIDFHKELLEGIIDLTLNHPLLYHAKDWRGHFPENAADKLFSGRTAIQNIGVDRTTNCSAFQVLHRIDDDSQPLHPLKRLLDPQVKFFQVEVVGRIILRILSLLRFQDRYQSVVLCKLALNGKGETLSDLVDVRLSLLIARYPVIHLLEKPTKFAKLAD